MTRRNDYRKQSLQRRKDRRKEALKDMKTEDESKKITSKSLMQTFKHGDKYPKEIQEVADFWRSLYYHNGTDDEVITKNDMGDSAIQEQILYELSDDGQVDSDGLADMKIASRNSSFSLSNLKKPYQVLIFDSYYAYKTGKGMKSELESQTMIDVMLKADLINTPKEKEQKKAIDTKVLCWSCGQKTKILSFDEAFQCCECGELLWIGEGGFNKVGEIYK